MSFPQTIDQVFTINQTDTLAAAKHTMLHTQALERIERTQSFIGTPLAGEKSGTIRKRLLDLENAIQMPQPILRVVAVPVGYNAAPTVTWDSGTGTLTLGIPVGTPGSPGAPGSPGIAYLRGTVPQQDYQPGITEVPVTFPPGSYTTAPNVLLSPVQKTSGSSKYPLALSVRDTTSVGFVVVAYNSEPSVLRYEVNWISL